MCAGVTLVDAFEASHLLVNYYGGGDPLVLEITHYDASLQELEEEFVRWMPVCDKDKMGIQRPVVFVLPTRTKPTEKGERK